MTKVISSFPDSHHESHTARGFRPAGGFFLPVMLIPGFR
ncbi:hypothetical protein EL79_5051 [Escherichia coli]|nr:hypothetical protein EL79_5051 [Escherichia coli]